MDSQIVKFQSNGVPFEELINMQELRFSWQLRLKLSSSGL